jgi:serine/threonine protein kinase
MPLADGVNFAGYTIVRLLGSGRMGEVYLAQHPRLPRRDALKVLPASVSADDEYRQRFNREADIAATLGHPHIIGVHDRGDFDGQICICMDYVEGAGSTVYCSTLRATGASIWPLSQGDVPSPTVTTQPTDEPLPIEEETPVRVCMQQTGQTRLRCREDVRRSNQAGNVPGP